MRSAEKKEHRCDIREAGHCNLGRLGKDTAIYRLNHSASRYERLFRALAVVCSDPSGRLFRSYAAAGCDALRPEMATRSIAGRLEPEDSHFHSTATAKRSVRFLFSHDRTHHHSGDDQCESDKGHGFLSRQPVKHRGSEHYPCNTFIF